MTCRELISQTLGMISGPGSRLGAFTYAASEQALNEAIAVDASGALRRSINSINGLPVAVKESIAVAGMPTSVGSKMDVSDLLPTQGTLIRRLREYGAIVIGKTVSTEFALSYQNLTLHTPLNPLFAAEAYTPGGSSSGSAVAVAAGLCAFAIGTDTGGSIRVPAAFCGITGFKPSTEFWPRDGVFPLSREIDTVGLLTRTPTDLVSVMEVLGGGVVPRGPLSSYRIGVPDSGFFADLDPAISQGVTQAINRLARMGAQVSRIVIPDHSAVSSFSRIVNSAAIVRFLGRDRVEAALDIVDPVTRARFETGIAADMFQVQSLMENRRVLANRVKSNLGHIDAIVIPTTPNLPVPVSSLDSVEAISAWHAQTGRNVHFANLFDFAAVTVPLPGPTPVGLQLMAAGGSELNLVGLSAVVAQALEVTG